MKMITAIAAAALAVCVTLGGCGTKKHDTVKPTAAPTATAHPAEKTEPTPTPLLDTDKTIDDLMDDAEKTKDDVKDKLEGEHDKLQNDLDTGADAVTADETENP